MPTSREEHDNNLTDRRTLLKGAGALAAALTTLELAGRGGYVPVREPLAAIGDAASSLPDIQFDIANYIAPAQTIDGVSVRFGPVHTTFLTAQLLRTPTKADQAALGQALEIIDANYPLTASGIFLFISYGLPYFRRLPGGLTGALVSAHMPRLLSDNSRYVLEEAVPGPTDVSSQNPGVTKLRYNVPVRIESNDILITIRGDNPAYVADVVSWLGGSDHLAGKSIASVDFGSLLTFTSSRAMFQQSGLPRSVATGNKLPFAGFINPQSPMWMGFTESARRSTRRPACRSAGSGTCPAYSAPRAPPTARRSTSGWTAPVSTAWTCPTAAASRSCNSPCSCPAPTSSAPCARTRPRSTWPPRTTWRPRTTDWNASSPPPDGRTSSCRRAGTAYSPWSN